MLGNRDSEIAAVIRDQDYIDSTMNGVPYKVSRFAHTLRMSLMTEHLGLPTGHDHNGKNIRGEVAPFTELDFVDPVHPAFYEDIWKHHAETNTLIFREMFKCIPDNTVKTWTQYNKFNDQSNVQDPRVNEEERTLKDKALDKILGPSLAEHFKSGGDNSSDDDDDDHPLSSSASRAASRAARKALAKDESDDDEDPVRDRAKDQKIINQDPSSEDMRKGDTKKKDKDLRTDEQVTAKGKTQESRLARQDKTENENMRRESNSSKVTSATSEMADRVVDEQETPQKKATAMDRHVLGVQRTASALVEMVMEEDLSKIQGHLVEWPLDFLRDEIESYNFCYPKDFNHPIDLYT